MHALHYSIEKRMQHLHREHVARNLGQEWNPSAQDAQELSQTSDALPVTLKKKARSTAEQHTEQKLRGQ
jgi:hypothetical protein